MLHFAPRKMAGPWFAKHGCMEISQLLFAVWAMVIGGILLATLREESVFNWPASKQFYDTSLGRNSANWLVALAASMAIAIGVWCI